MIKVGGRHRQDHLFDTGPGRGAQPARGDPTEPPARCSLVLISGRMRGSRGLHAARGTGGWCRAGGSSTGGAPERGVIGKPPPRGFLLFVGLGAHFYLASGPAGAARGGGGGFVRAGGGT